MQANTRKPAAPGRLIGYARVSTEKQGTDRQRDELHAAGCGVIVEEQASPPANGSPFRSASARRNDGAENSCEPERSVVSQFECRRCFQSQHRSCLGWRIDTGGKAKLFQLLYMPLLEVNFCAACAAWSKENHPLKCHSTTTGHVGIPAQQRLRDSIHILDLEGRKPISFCSSWHASTRVNSNKGTQPDIGFGNDDHDKPNCWRSTRK